MGKVKSVAFSDEGSLRLDVEYLEIKLKALAQKEGRTIKKVHYSFVSREKILRINTSHLQHNYETDIITFDYTKGKDIVGDVYVCPEVVKDNAADLNVSFESELVRVIFHGLLHLVGYGDGTQKEAELMRKKEDEYLNS